MYTGHERLERALGQSKLRTVRKWVNLAVLVRGSVNSAETRKSVLSVNVHSTRPADTLSARPPEGERGVDLVFNFD